MINYLKRNLEEIIVKSLQTFSCIYINGPRQVGKTTLVRRVAQEYLDAEYITFDDPFMLAKAKESPMNFLNEYKKSIILDEIQMVPELFRPLKIRIDEIRQKGLEKKQKIILTGSTNIMTIPKLANALVGRMAIFTLYPLSCTEILNNKNSKNFIEYLFNTDFSHKKIKNKNQINIDDIITKATFPEISLSIKKSIKPYQKKEWFNNYIRTILDRDIKEISEIQKIDAFPRLLQALAGRTGSLLNDANISQSLSLDKMTTKRYRILMEAVFLIKRVQPWLNNIGKRVFKSPKLFFIDTELLLSILNTDIHDLKEKNKNLYGHIIENFIGMELLKQISYLPTIHENNLYHYRDRTDEVDFVIEKSFDEIIGIEIKAKTNLDFSKDTKGLKTLELVSGKKFKKGIILYQGDTIQSCSNNIWAVPMSMLWNV